MPAPFLSLTRRHLLAGFATAGALCLLPVRAGGPVDNEAASSGRAVRSVALSQALVGVQSRSKER